MRARSLAALAALAAPAAVGAIDVDPYWLEKIPAEYHGRWNVAAGPCAPFAGRFRLEVAAKRLTVGRDSFVPQYVRWHEEGGISVVSRYAGPARPWTRVDYFVLSTDRRTLTDEHARRKIVRRRCAP